MQHRSELVRTRAILNECARQARDDGSAVPAAIYITTLPLYGLPGAVGAAVRKAASDFADARLDHPREVERTRRYELIGACKVAVAFLE